MDVYFGIFIRDKMPTEIEKSMTKIFEAWGFAPASAEIKARYPFPAQKFSFSREGLLVRAFFISSQQEGGWCFLVPSYHVWFDEALDVCKLLSNELACPVLLLLQDNGYGWGYFLYKNGKVIDRFHANPSSPTLHQKGAKSPQDLELLLLEAREATPEEKKVYEGHAEVIAETFNIQAGKIPYYLSISRRDADFTTHYEMGNFMRNGLGVPDGWDISYYAIYRGEVKNPDLWLNLVFVRKMSPVEQAWYDSIGMDAPGESPPLWLNENDSEEQL